MSSCYSSYLSDDNSFTERRSMSLTSVIESATEPDSTGSWVTDNACNRREYGTYNNAKDSSDTESARLEMQKTWLKILLGVVELVLAHWDANPPENMLGLFNVLFTASPSVRAIIERGDRRGEARSKEQMLQIHSCLVMEYKYPKSAGADEQQHRHVCDLNLLGAIIGSISTLFLETKSPRRASASASTTQQPEPRSPLDTFLDEASSLDVQSLPDTLSYDRLPDTPTAPLKCFKVRRKPTTSSYSGLYYTATPRGPPALPPSPPPSPPPRSRGHVAVTPAALPVPATTRTFSSRPSMRYSVQWTEDGKDFLQQSIFANGSVAVGVKRLSPLLDSVMKSVKCLAHKLMAKREYHQYAKNRVYFQGTNCLTWTGAH